MNENTPEIKEAIAKYSGDMWQPAKWPFCGISSTSYPDLTKSKDKRHKAEAEEDVSGGVNNLNLKLGQVIKCPQLL